MPTNNRKIKSHRQMWHQPPISVRVVKAVLIGISLITIAAPFAMFAKLIGG